jgi:hypothetical protein
MDIRQQAVDEMMQRIKRGVHLRPVGQAPNKTKPVQVHAGYTSQRVADIVPLQLREKLSFYINALFFLVTGEMAI